MLKPLFWKKVGAAFAWSFLTTFALGVADVVEKLSGEGAAFDLSAMRSALVALVIASIVAGLRGGQALFTTWETPKPAVQEAAAGQAVPTT